MECTYILKNSRHLPEELAMCIPAGQQEVTRKGLFVGLGYDGSIQEGIETYMIVVDVPTGIVREVGPRLVRFTNEIKGENR